MSASVTTFHSRGVRLSRSFRNFSLEVVYALPFVHRKYQSNSYLSLQGNFRNDRVIQDRSGHAGQATEPDLSDYYLEPAIHSLLGFLCSDTAESGKFSVGGSSPGGRTLLEIRIIGLEAGIPHSSTEYPPGHCILPES